MKTIFWMLQAFALGGLVMLVAGGLYRFIEWQAPDMDPHNRGMLEGAVFIFVVDKGFDIAKRIVHPKKTIT